jgi:hypothetical protein
METKNVLPRPSVLSTEPSAVAIGSIRLPESIEYTRKTFGRYTAAGVGDPKHNLVLSRVCPRRDLPSGVRELHRVPHEILEHAQKSIVVTQDLGEVARHIEPYLE